MHPTVPTSSQSGSMVGSKLYVEDWHSGSIGCHRWQCWEISQFPSATRSNVHPSTPDQQLILPLAQALQCRYHNMRKSCIQPISPELEGSSPVLVLNFICADDISNSCQLLISFASSAQCTLRLIVKCWPFKVEATRPPAGWPLPCLTAPICPWQLPYCPTRPILLPHAAPPPLLIPPAPHSS